MHSENTRAWHILNVLLLAAVALAVFTLFPASGWLRGVKPAAIPGETAAAAALASTAPSPTGAPHRIAVADARPVSFAFHPEAATPREAWARRGVQPEEWDWLPASPGMDMAETPGGYLVIFSLPGVGPNDVRLTMTNGMMTMQAKVRNIKGHEVDQVLRRVQLPPSSGGIQTAPVRVDFSNGMLRVSVQK